MYVQKHFKEDSKQAALEMVADIRREFDSILDEIDWMDPRTKKRAKAKAAGIVEHIGYPPELLNAQKLNDLYEGLELNSTHYLGNALNMTVFGTNYAFSKLREKVRGFKAQTHASVHVRTFFSGQQDRLDPSRPSCRRQRLLLSPGELHPVPGRHTAGKCLTVMYAPVQGLSMHDYFQGIFFSNDRPRYMNYGAIGWVIGHEITHGFDDQGRQFDMEGEREDRTIHTYADQKATRGD